MFDIVIRGGRVVDGSGSPWYRGDVGIEGERITAIGKLADVECPTTIDATGKIVCPGFIDTHVHGDLALLADPQHAAAIHQGVTTYINGQDGCGFAPASPETIRYMRDYTAGFTGDYPELECDWSSVDEYLQRFHRHTSVNVAYLIPNGTVRMEAMGLSDSRPTPDQLRIQQRLVREALEQGAVGLSTGLEYIPSLFADTDEIAALCETVAEYDGVYVTHVRANGGTTMSEAVDEVFEIGRKSGCNLHISHFNTGDQMLARVDRRRAEGYDITFDTYPYRAGMTFLAMPALPVSIQQDGPKKTLERLQDSAVRRQVADWWARRQYGSENIMIAHAGAEEHRDLEGMRLTDAAEARGLPVAELICRLLIDSRLQASAVVFQPDRSEADVIACMTHPVQMGSSDGIFTGRFTHPRGWGSFASFVGPYVRDHKAWSLEEAVRHLTDHPARRYRLPDRGLVRRGMVADLVVFDPDRVAPGSTYEAPREPALGVEHVFVAGAHTLADGVHTGVTNGQALRRVV